MDEKIDKKGSLEVVCGSMFSGKTEELMRRLRRAEYAKQNVLTIKNQIDNRRGETHISTHDGAERLAFNINNNQENLSKITELANRNIDVVGIDEMHFFPIELVEIIKKLVENGKRVIVAGLDMDFRGEPFEIAKSLLALADRVTKLKAICVICGKDAHFTQRIVSGEPARYDDPIILVGARDFYQARCRDCFRIREARNINTQLNEVKQAAL